MEKASRSTEQPKYNPVSPNIIQIIMVVLLIVAAFFLGSLFTKVQYLQKGPTAGGTTPATAQQPAQPSVTFAQVKDAFNKSLIKFGDANKKVVFVEVSDPSCPYCHIAGGMDKELNNQSDQFKMVADGGTYVAPVPEMKKLVDSGQAAFSLIYYPGHGNGQMGAKALYCAFVNGKFWEVNDLIMSNNGYNMLNNTVKNDQTKSGDLAQFLSPAIDPSLMKSCLDSGKYDDRLSQDQKLAGGLAISGTPGFYVNATPFAGAYSYANMQSVVNAALAGK